MRCWAIPGVRRVKGCRPAGNITASTSLRAGPVHGQQAGSSTGCLLAVCPMRPPKEAIWPTSARFLSNLSVRQETLQLGQWAKCHGHPPDKTRRAFGTCARSFEPRRSIDEPMENEVRRGREAIALQRPANLGVELPPCVEVARRRCRDVVIGSEDGRDDSRVGHARDATGPRLNISRLPLHP